MTFDERGKIKLPRILGYSMFNVFINKNTKNQPKERGEQAECLLNDGLYQIPIFCQPFKKNIPFYVKDCYQYDKLPASSVLLRIKRAPMSTDGLKVLSVNTPGFETKKKKEEFGIWELPPKYNTGAYNSDMCGARQSEIELAEIRAKRQAIETRKEVLAKLKPTYEEVLRIKEEDSKLIGLKPKEKEKRMKELEAIRKQRANQLGLNNDLVVPGHNNNVEVEKKDESPEKKDENQPPKPDEKKEGEDKKEGNKEEEMKEGGKKEEDKDNNLANNNSMFSAENVGGAQTNRSRQEIEQAELQEDEGVYQIVDTVFTYKKEMDFLNLKFFSKYREEGGFKFIIDGLHKLPKRSFYITTYTLNPPGEYYINENPKSMRVYTNFDWERSTVDTIRYNEGYVKFSKIPFNTSLHFIVEISSVELPAFREPEIKEVGWTILPLFVIDPLSGQGYVNSNIYQLPLFEGGFKKEYVGELVQGDPWKKIEQMVSSKKIKYWGKASAMCRLLDIQREGHFNQPFDYERCSHEYLPEGKESDYVYLREDDVKLEKKKAKMLRTIIPYLEDPYSFNKRLSEVCFKKYDINLPE